MTTMLVIDTTSRDLRAYTAHVTRAEAGLVIRAALELPGLAFLAKGRDWKFPLEVDLPVLLLGQGYQAQSSAGHVNVRGPVGHTAYVVGRMDFGRPLRFCKPASAMLLQPIRIIADMVMTNSNFKTAAAAQAGLGLLAQSDPRAIVIEEGASDYSVVFRLLPLDPSERYIRRFTLDDIEEEHRDKFSVKSVLANQLRFYIGNRYPDTVVESMLATPIGTLAERRAAVTAYAAERGVLIEGKTVQPLEEWEKELMEMQEPKGPNPFGQM